MTVRLEKSPKSGPLAVGAGLSRFLLKRISTSGTITSVLADARLYRRKAVRGGHDPALVRRVNQSREDWSFMPSNEINPLPERVIDSYSKLSVVAQELNSASDELGNAVTQIDTALKKLNLGVVEWVKLAGRPADPQNREFWEESDEIGYAKVSGKWGIAIRTVGENLQDPDQSSEEKWLFNDAPRALRLLAIDKIADLLDALAVKATTTKDDIRKRLKDAEAVADAVTKVSGGRLPLRNRGITPPPTTARDGAK